MSTDQNRHLKFLIQVASSLRPELVITLREYDPAQPNMPVTLAWDRTQSRVSKSKNRKHWIVSHKIFRIKVITIFTLILVELLRNSIGQRVPTLECLENEHESQLGIR